VLASFRLKSANTYALFYICIWLIGAGIGFFQSQFGGRIFGWWENAVQFVICAFWGALILPEQYSRRTRVGNLLFVLGESSYSLYILHFPLMLFLLSVTQSLIGTTYTHVVSMCLLSVMISVVVAHFTAYWFENKKYFLSRIRSIGKFLSSFIRHVGKM
jgi:peptidoglycan/LPS O-acetylase OafA/YrhL